MYVNKKYSISLLSFLLVLFFAFQSMSAVPGLINYQGKLTDDTGVPVANGNHSMRFYLFNTATGGSQLWNSPNGEQQSVAVIGGIYNVQLGVVQPLTSTIFNGGIAWLEVAVYDTVTSTWETMSPRQRVTSTAFALKAADADTLQGVAPSGFASNSHTHGFPNISGTANDSQIPDTITINYAATAGSAASATNAGNADTVDGEHASAFADAVHGHPFSQITDSVTDAQVPNDITVNYAGDADKVDGLHASAFMLSDADDWVNENGDTMSGPLEVETNILGSGWGVSIKGILHSDDVGVGVFGFSDGATAHGVYGGATGDSGKGIYGEATGLDGVAVHGNASGNFGIGVYGSGSMYSGFFDNRVKIGPSDTWNVGEERGIYFGDSGYVFIGEKDGDDVLTLKAKGGIRFEDADIRVEGSTDWDTVGDQAVVGLGMVSEHFYIKAVWGDSLRLGAFGTNAHDGIVLQQLTGNVGIGTTAPTSRLDVNGTTTTKLLIVTNGSDIAESFDVNAEIDIIPGMVLTIDVENPGKLKVSRKSYDRRVAGIISAAGGVNSGVIISQTGTITEGEYPVALTGRVYCWADAGNGAIIPGDLLTTSEKPGHAMKVTEYARAQGAVLGKAMTPLQTGTGLVMVLVSLQ